MAPSWTPARRTGCRNDQRSRSRPERGCSTIILQDCAVDHPHRRKAADPMKKILVLLGILTSLAILAVLAILLFLDINAHKPKIETAATQALGMDVKIQGKAAMSLS